MNIIILTEPTEKFVCCGQSQNVSAEIDVKFCKKNNIGYTRRIAGGTTVFLDENQIFYNVILYGYNFPTPLKALYKKSLKGPIDFYNSLKLEAFLNNYNEISVENRKISGIGAYCLEKTGLVVGNIILDFDYDMCVKALRFPSENFKSLFRRYLENSVTSIKRELQKEIPKDEIYDGLISTFEKNLNIKLVEDKLTNWEIKKNKELEKEYQTEKWLNPHREDMKKEKIFVKIRKGQFIFHYTPLSAEFVIENKKITEIICDSSLKEVSTLKGINIDEISEKNSLFRDLKKNLLKFQVLSEN
ncbi:MAG: lipoate--protein ligase family protein [Candidatus Helarchaeota archaeon]|nr:lipoate--protein ligase family protein [Candidatus Helarchaeota archaeon]